MLRKLCRPLRARVFDDDFGQSELRSCNFMIEPLNQDHRDHMDTADHGTHKNRTPYTASVPVVSKLYFRSIQIMRNININ